MEVYRTEEEQVDALKDWWKENGRSVIIGALIALAAVFGWRYWQDTTRLNAESASTLYQQMLMQLDGGEDRAVIETARRIIAEHAKSTYAALASFSLAQQLVDQNDLDGAAAHLRWVMENSKLAELHLIAQLRLARVTLAQGRVDESLQLLAQINDKNSLALVEETKGDALLAKNDRGQALRAYQAAMAASADVPGKQQMLQMKIDDLSDAEVAAQ
ncbi:MAG: tetratricopeptide repeat protein [Thiohalomonadaceae bacterium]